MDQDPNLISFAPVPMNVFISIEEGMRKDQASGEVSPIKMVKVVMRSQAGEAHYFFEGGFAEWLGQQIFMRGKEAQSSLHIAQQMPQNGQGK